MSYAGIEVHGELHSTDADPAVAIPLFRASTLESVTIKETEFLDIHSIEFVTAAGGDCYMFIGEDSTVADGEYVFRGTFAASGGLANRLVPHYSGVKGGSPYLSAPAGAVDVIIKGCIRER